MMPSRVYQQYCELVSATLDGDVEAVRRFFTQPDVLENVAICNGMHRRRRLREPPSMDPPLDFIPWYAGTWLRGDFFGSRSIPRCHVDVFRWFFARDQLELFEDTLRGLAGRFMRSCVKRGAVSTTREMVEIVLESPLFTEAIEEQERRDLLEIMMSEAAFCGHDKWLDMLLAYGADPNRSRRVGAPLTAIVFLGSAETLEVLLTHGVWVEGRCILEWRAENAVEPPIEALVGDLLRSGADANVGVEERGSALHQAVRHRRHCTAQLLIGRGFADMDARDHRGRTPLMLAAAARPEPDGPPPSYEIAKLLVDAGADLHAVDNSHRGVLHYAVTNKQNGASHQAVGGWSPKCLRLFLERGANPNLPDVRGLVFRARSNIHGNIKEMLRLLLRAGADPFISDNHGHCVAQLLQRSEAASKSTGNLEKPLRASIHLDKDVDVLRWFFAREQRELFEDTLRGPTMRILHSCISIDGLPTTRETLEIVLESPLFNETMDEQERRGLLGSCVRDYEASQPVICYVGNAETLEVLLAHGACAVGCLLRITGLGDVLVEDLLRSGADANAQQPNQTSLLHQAAMHRRHYTARLLVEKGFVDVSVCDHRGCTPLMVAVAVRSERFEPPPSQAIAQLLLDAGADVHAVDNNLRGVLHHVVNNKQRDASRQAVGRWNPNCLRLFLERGANPNLQDDHGRTPLTTLLMRARCKVHGNIKELATLLLQAGADPFVLDNRGRCVAQLLERSETGLAFMHEKPVLFTPCDQADSEP